MVPIFSYLRIALPTVALCLGFGVAARAAEVELLKTSTPDLAHIQDGNEKPFLPPATFPQPGQFQVLVRQKFTLSDVPSLASMDLLVSQDLALDHVLWKLNGNPIAIPVEGMRYMRLPGINPAWLKAGENELSGLVLVEVAEPKAGAGKVQPVVLDPKVGLIGFTADDLAFQTGPVLGPAGPDYLTVTCRTNMVATVKLEVGSKVLNSEPGLMHHFTVRGLQPATSYTYELTATFPGKTKGTSAGPFTMRTFPAKDGYTFIVMGDNRSNPRVWGQVATAAGHEHPSLMVLTGDMTPDGRYDNVWDPQFFAPAAAQLATIPCYPVLGNHEHGSALWPHMMLTPGGKRNWSQRIGPVHFIGIDGAADWQAGSPNYKWLEQTLSEADAPFVFVATHYPAWTSGRHGAIDAQGHSVDPNMRAQGEVIMPLLKRYHVSALLAGHEHSYERSDPGEKGVVQITTGGAGAPLYPKAEQASTQNPYSQVFNSVNHYCVFKVDEHVCTMKVVTLQGKQIDEYRWEARNDACGGEVTGANAFYQGDE